MGALGVKSGHLWRDRPGFQQRQRIGNSHYRAKPGDFRRLEATKELTSGQRQFEGKFLALQIELEL
jgi:hypothetical protein